MKNFIATLLLVTSACAHSATAPCPQPSPPRAPESQPDIAGCARVHGLKMAEARDIGDDRGYESASAAFLACAAGACEHVGASDDETGAKMCDFLRSRSKN